MPGTREEDGSLGTMKDKQLATLSKRTVVALLTPLANVALVARHTEKALLPIFVTLSGIAILVSHAHANP